MRKGNHGADVNQRRADSSSPGGAEWENEQEEENVSRSETKPRGAYQASKHFGQRRLRTVIDDMFILLLQVIRQQQLANIENQRIHTGLGRQNHTPRCPHSHQHTKLSGADG